VEANSNFLVEFCFLSNRRASDELRNAAVEGIFGTCIQLHASEDRTLAVLGGRSEDVIESAAIRETVDKK